MLQKRAFSIILHSLPPSHMPNPVLLAPPCKKKNWSLPKAHVGVVSRYSRTPRSIPYASAVIYLSRYMPSFPIPAMPGNLKNVEVENQKRSPSEEKSQGSMSLLLILIMSSLSLAIHRHLSNAPSTGRKLYLALASMSLSRLLTIVAAVRKRSKLIKGSLSRVLATTDGFCALYVRSWM